MFICVATGFVPEPEEPGYVEPLDEEAVGDQ
jgi:hypothetical protein